jgi:hypothetical protein
VVVLEEAADDLEAGKVFYDQRKPGVGSYFWGSFSAYHKGLFLIVLGVICGPSSCKLFVKIIKILFLSLLFRVTFAFSWLTAWQVISSFLWFSETS